MQRKKLSVGSRSALATLMVALLATSAWAATEKVLYSFNGNGSGGQDPLAALIFDAAGNLYGTTQLGGALGFGTVFELTPITGGGWEGTVLWSFGKDTDGRSPQASLIFDASGNLYGTTYAGGKYGYGTVFELSPKTGGGWTETVLHNFNENHKDGILPEASLIFDASGNLYGTTYTGGDHNDGTAFELSPKTGGGWTERVLHTFNEYDNDGALPAASLIFDAFGNLYGTTYFGGKEGGGSVFELSPKTGGGWKERVLHSFPSGRDSGWEPDAGLILDASGNLYGTTSAGGKYSLNGVGGTVFELSPKAGGRWAETVLHSFDSTGKDGNSPVAGLIFDASGNLYGTTSAGGKFGGGTAFELSPKTGGGWTETMLHSFGEGSDGYLPDASLIFDGSGNLYGTTPHAGAYGYGTVFEIAP